MHELWKHQDNLLITWLITLQLPGQTLVRTSFLLCGSATIAGYRHKIVAWCGSIMLCGQFKTQPPASSNMVTTSGSLSQRMRERQWRILGRFCKQEKGDTEIILCSTLLHPRTTALRQKIRIQRRNMDFHLLCLSPNLMQPSPSLMQSTVRNIDLQKRDPQADLHNKTTLASVRLSRFSTGWTKLWFSQSGPYLKELPGMRPLSSGWIMNGGGCTFQRNSGSIPMDPTRRKEQERPLYCSFDRTSSAPSKFSVGRKISDVDQGCSGALVVGPVEEWVDLVLARDSSVSSDITHNHLTGPWLIVPWIVQRPLPLPVLSGSSTVPLPLRMSSLFYQGRRISVLVVFRDLLRTESLKQMFEDAGAHVVGIQETRMRKLPKGETERYFVIGGAANSQGHYGVQLWFSKNLGWTRSESLLRVLCTRTLGDWLWVWTHHSSKQIIICAHGPHGQVADEWKQRWWAELHRCIPPRFQNWAQFLLIDANARLGDHPCKQICFGDHQAEVQD